MRAHPLLPLSLLALLLLAGWWAYQPGLSGAFLFDDFKNLGQLGDYGRVRDWPSLLLYVTAGDADPTGRPLAMLSFLLDADDWPADPEPFKYTNILLHLLNGLLLAWLLLWLGRRLRLAPGRAAAAALLAAVLWTLHPLWVSTTLYVVQREAMLAATFCLLGLLLWVAGRDRIEQRKGGGVPLMVAGAWGCSALALLCKGNGILLPLLIGVTEFSLPGRVDARAPGNAGLLRRMQQILLAPPAALIALWLGHALVLGIVHGPTEQGWTIPQRLLSQPRAILSYLQLLWVPRGSPGGLLNDDFRLSTDLLHPWTTLPALLLVVALLAAGLRLRRRYPAVSVALLFYFAGHLVESSVLPLELYFEHRNYLPAMLLFWPLALWLCSAAAPLPRLRVVVATLLPCLLALLAHARAVVWGRPFEQAQLFAQASPHSSRAQMAAAYYLLAYGRPALAASAFRKTLSEFPDEAVAALHLIEADCAQGQLPADDDPAIQRALSENRIEAGVVHYWMVGQIELAQSGSCRRFDLDYMEKMLAAVRDNPHYAAETLHARDVEHLEGSLALARGDNAAALAEFDRSLAHAPTPDQALLQAALLASNGAPALGLQHLDRYARLPPPPAPGFDGMPWVHRAVLRHLGYWDARVAELRKTLVAETQQQASAPAKDAAPVQAPVQAPTPAPASAAPALPAR